MLGIVGRQTPVLVDFGAKRAGLLTVGYQLLNADGTAHGSHVTAGIGNVAGGIYMAHLGLEAGWSGSILWDTGEEPPVYAAEDLTAARLDFLDVAVSSRATLDSLGGLLASTTVEVVGPVSTTEGIVLLAGDDYLAVDGRALVWSDLSGSRWPTLTGATVTMVVTDAQSAGGFQAVGVVTKATGTPKTVRVDVPGALTEPWLVRRTTARYRLTAVLQDLSEVTLVNGDLLITTPQGP